MYRVGATGQRSANGDAIAAADKTPMPVAGDRPIDAGVLTRARGPACSTEIPRVDARGELAALRRMLTSSRSEVHRTTWRRAAQARTTTIARVVRVAQRALRLPGVRHRVAEGWIVCAGTSESDAVAVLTVITRAPTRSLVDLACAIPVVVERPNLVDLDELRVLGETITLTFAEVD